MIYIFFKYVPFERVLPESLECKYFGVHIYRFVYCILVFFASFFYKMHCFEWRRRKMANNYVLGLKA